MYFDSHLIRKSIGQRRSSPLIITAFGGKLLVPILIIHLAIIAACAFENGVHDIPISPEERVSAAPKPTQTPSIPQKFLVPRPDKLLESEIVLLPPKDANFEECLQNRGLLLTTYPPSCVSWDGTIHRESSSTTSSRGLIERWRLQP